MKLLLYSNIPEHRDAMLGLLGSLGDVTVSRTDSLEDTLHLLHQPAPPRIVLLATTQPLADTRVIHAQTRAPGRAGYTYILAVTEPLDDVETAALLDAGADDVAIVPVAPAKLAARLRVARRILQTEDQLHESRSFAEQILDLDSNFIHVKDEQGRFVLVNKAFLDALGTTREEILGQNAAVLEPDPAELEGYTRVEQQVLATGRTIRTEESFTGPDGQKRWFVSSRSPLRRADGSVHVLGVSREVTSERQAREALQASESHLHAIIEHSNAIIFSLSPRWRFELVSPAWKLHLGHEPEEVEGRPFTDFIYPDDLSILRQAIREALEHQTYLQDLEFRMIHRDGSGIWVSISGAQVLNERDEITGYVGVAQNITDRKRIEDQLRQADRLVSIGTLSAGIAHEINNPLSFVLSNIDHVHRVLSSVADENPDDPLELGDLRDALDDARTGGRRIRSIIEGLKGFSHRGNGRQDPLDLHTVLQTAVKMVHNELRHRAVLDLNLRPVPSVLGSEGDLGQVFVNLLINAIQAMPVRELAQNRIQVALRADAGEVVVEIRDNGVGMPPAVRDRVFDPFFTTKDVGEGTGLGLYICHTIVTALQGRLEIDSRPGQGTSVRVILPPCEDAGTTVELDAPVTMEFTTRPDLLVIDDELAIGRSIRRLLMHDIDVTVDTDANSALARFQAGERFDAILCDVMLPGMSGPRFYDALLKVRPEMARRVGFISGGIFDDDTRRALESGALPFLRKPFNDEELRTFLNTLLA